MIQGTTKAITLFNYDDQGNLALVIDPKKQHTTYKYNLLGWMYSKTTVDGGTTKYLYDVSGNVVLEQDATGAAGEPDAYFEVASEPWNRPWYRRYRFDGFGRPVAQERVRADHPCCAWLPWHNGAKLAVGYHVL
ncbi:MAG: RHS repeat protein [Flavobacteriales bacterium]|nr:RHS repeat protein [Flavobacteriales bacterium]